MSSYVHVRVAGMAGKAGRRVFKKVGQEKLQKDSLFNGTWLEKLEFYFCYKSHQVLHL